MVHRVGLGNGMLGDHAMAADRHAGETLMGAPQRLRVAVLLNAAAGTVARMGAANLEKELLFAFNRAGLSASLGFFSGGELRGAAEQALQKVRENTLDALMVGGGDGSVRTVASVLAGTDVPLGILPLGTLNHFARDLGLPLDPSQAVAVLAFGALRSVDLGSMNGEIFLNNSSIGLYPFLVLERERQRRGQHVSKWIAMCAAIPRVLRNLPLFPLSVRVGDLAEACRSPLVFIGNNEYQLALTALGRRQRLDGGELSIYVAKAKSTPELFGLACRVVLGFSAAGDMRIVKGKSAAIESRRHHLLVAFDGEVERLRPPLHYEIRPRALRVFASAGSTA
jgi:diacylglycerol kinase family enzyme